MKTQKYSTKSNTLFIWLKCLTLTILPALIFSSNVRQIDGLESCKYTMADGSHVDFWHLRKTYDYVFQMNRYVYKANFCGVLIDQCPGSTAPAAIFIKSKKTVL